MMNRFKPNEGVIIASSEMSAINTAGTAFFSEVLALYKTRLRAAEALIETACAKPFNFTLNDTYKETDSRPATDKQLAERWYYQLKADVLSSLYPPRDAEETVPRASYIRELKPAAKTA